MILVKSFPAVGPALHTGQFRYHIKNKFQQTLRADSGSMWQALLLANIFSQNTGSEIF